ncbi:MAG TPA: MFS transporter [Candidatus Acidoferrum sp.]|nr:MFS transporter [Candidatus Acidoferrum sp.]
MQLTAFKHRPFKLYWLARFTATFAVQVISVAVAWQVYDITRDAFDLGILGIVQFLPMLLLVLITGATADRFGHRRVMVLSVAVEVLCALAILAFAWHGLSSPMPIFVVLTVLAVARAFFGPASQALTVHLVPKLDFANAIAWNASAWQIATIVGPMAGGLLYGAGASVAYGTSLLLIVLSLVLLLQIPDPPKPAEIRKITFASLFEGLHFIRRERLVLGAISLDLFAVLLGGAVALMPVYARDILQLGPWGLGLLRAAPGVGAVLMTLALSAMPVRDHAGKVLLFFVGLFGLFTVGFGVSTTPWLSILMLALLGAADTISVVIRETLLQLWTPDAVRGRVNAVNMVFVGASNELGEFRAGLMAAWIGAVPAVVVGGIGAIGVAALWGILFPTLRDARYLDGRK